MPCGSGRDLRWDRSVARLWSHTIYTRVLGHHRDAPALLQRSPRTTRAGTAGDCGHAGGHSPARLHPTIVMLPDGYIMGTAHGSRSSCADVAWFAGAHVDGPRLTPSSLRTMANELTDDQHGGRAPVSQTLSESPGQSSHDHRRYSLGLHHGRPILGLDRGQTRPTSCPIIMVIM